MRYEMIATAYDVLDKVHVVVRVASRDSMPRTDFQWETVVGESFTGRGEDDQRKWLRDALMFMAEAL